MIAALTGPSLPLSCLTVSAASQPKQNTRTASSSPPDESHAGNVAIPLLPDLPRNASRCVRISVPGTASRGRQIWPHSSLVTRLSGAAPPAVPSTKDLLLAAPPTSGTERRSAVQLSTVLASMLATDRWSVVEPETGHDLRPHRPAEAVPLRSGRRRRKPRNSDLQAERNFWHPTGAALREIRPIRTGARSVEHVTEQGGP
jgi:hypothetical protein